MTDPVITFTVKQYGQHKWVWVVLDEERTILGQGTESSKTRALRCVEAIVVQHYFPPDEVIHGDYKMLMQALSELNQDRSM